MSFAPAIVQAMCAIIGLEIVRRRVLPNIGGLMHAGLYVNVWGPVTLVIPLLAATGRVESTGGETAWAVLGQSLLLMPMGLACAMLAGGTREPESEERGGWTADWACWVGAAVVLMLTAAVGKLSMPVGQCALALAAVLMWWRTPPQAAAGAGLEERVQRRSMKTWNAISVVLLIAIGQGAAVHFAEVGWGQRASMMCASLYVLVYLASVARQASAEVAMRMGGWGMAVGGLAGLGLITITKIFPAVMATMADPHERIHLNVAQGLGVFVVEGSAALMCAAAGPLALRWPRGVKAVLGVAMLAGVFALTWWRITGN